MMKTSGLEVANVITHEAVRKIFAVKAASAYPIFYYGYQPNAAGDEPATNAWSKLSVWQKRSRAIHSRKNHTGPASGVFSLRSV